jgi:hypothetical protein
VLQLDPMPLTVVHRKRMDLVAFREKLRQQHGRIEPARKNGNSAHKSLGRLSER